MTANNLDSTMPDVQDTVDLRQIPIQRVGVRAVRYPLSVAIANRPAQPTTGVFNMDVALSAAKKGAHMSRFIALLEETTGPFNLTSFRAMLKQMLEKLEATAGRIEVSFPYFINKTAPISKVQSLMDYQVTLTGEAQAEGIRIFLKVQVPVTSLCPCSKKISQYGAHNQRSIVTIDAEINVETKGEISIEELVRMAEEEASCELWGVLKRPDEKFVTEHAYDNPKFVEDLVRDVAGRLNQDERIIAYVLEAENFESIHNHSAYALIQGSK